MPLFPIFVINLIFLTLDSVPLVEIHSEIDDISKCFDVSFHNFSKRES